MHTAHPEFVPAIVILDPLLPGTATMMRNKADHAGAAPYERAPARRRWLDGEGGGSGTERAVVAGQSGRWRQDREGGGGGTERAVGRWQGHGEGGGGGMERVHWEL